MDPTVNSSQASVLDQRVVLTSLHEHYKIDFEELKTSDKFVGGKAYGLAMMKQASLNVPAGTIFIREPQTEAEWNDFEQWWKTHDLKPLAVRSSFGAEDAAGQSFAGQNKSFLNITSIDQLKLSVRECFESPKARASSTYTSHFNVSTVGQRMNVVIQVMVEPHFAGVYFSKDPKSNGWLIEYIEGLGEDLVSGRRTPFQAKEDGVQNHHPQWSSEWNKAISEAGNTIRSLFNFEVDMEWAIDFKGTLFVLQARPITTQQSNLLQEEIDKELKRLKDNYSSDTVWDGRTFSEWTGFPTYLTFSIWKNAFEPEHSFGDALRMVGYASFDKSGAGFKTSVLERVFGRAYVNLDKMTSLYFGPIPYTVVAKPRVSLKFCWRKLNLQSLLLAPASIYRMIRVGWRLTAHRKDWLAQCKDELLQFRTKLSRPLNPLGYSSLSDEKLYEQFFGESHDFSKKNLLWPFVLIILTESTMQSLLSLLRSVVGEKADATLRTWMAHGINTVTFEMNEGFKLACMDASKRTQFLSAYGHRGQGELDLSKKRWVEKGAQAFEQFEARSLARPAPAQAVQKTVEEEILELETFKKDLILTEWKYLKSMLELREHWKMEILKPYAEIRFMALEIGRRTGLNDDIFWLRLSEIEKYKTSLQQEFKDSLESKVLQRKARFHAFKNFHFPEYIQLSEIDDLLSDKPKSREAVLEGQAISPGLVFGTVCVVHDYDDVDLSQWPEDAILVADATDPGWTPLFVRSKAIVVARGGALSHCAIVAREMNLPAVSEVTSCTSLLQDGMKIWVDGNLGRVILESKSA